MSRAVVGYRGKMRAHRAAGVKQPRAVLDAHAGAGIGVVAAPDLRAEIQHTAVKPRPAPGAIFQQKVGVSFGQAALQFVNAQHIAVVNLTLPCGGQRGAVHIGKAAVHIPFEIADGAGIQHRLQLCPDAVHNLKA